MATIPKELNKPGINNVIIRTLYIWFTDKYPSKYSRKSIRIKYNLKWYAGYLFFTGIGPAYHKFITKITTYYPFSLLFKGSWIHAENMKAREFRDDLETVAKEANLPIIINSGNWDKELSAFNGEFTKRVSDKNEATVKLQQLFQEKYGDVFVQNENRGFRILVNTRLLIE